MDSYKIFNELKSYLSVFESELSVLHNKSDNYYVNTISKDSKKKPQFFAAVQIKKSYVAYHLMPIYYHPELLEKVSENLRNKMQGKSCFNFKVFDTELLKELNILTMISFNKYKELKKI